MKFPSVSCSYLCCTNVFHDIPPFRGDRDPNSKFMEQAKDGTCQPSSDGENKTLNSLVKEI